MADADKLELLRGEFHSQTARTEWHDLQVHFARGAVVLVAPELDLVEVAVQLQVDNKQEFEDWIARGLVAGVSPEQGQAFYAANTSLWTVVAPPWVLVQQSDKEPPGAG
ncbi:DUF2288 domain-containing protein [Halieaceae bacterium IMCC14734]|uniref:DUF2288 domain-containing protein n=1 Tax=Candidatus Litorirhabdus singularis TaxID=2518993 RepID=A0ABT3TKW1_9GAMM|nr:DUF2288 domain-containing protein [Candidatus Litorirhabdus singularis]MCX2982639.1 DUF2288 domain-containing protein [Candidatus Litorirhabdus singularis]